MIFLIQEPFPFQKTLLIALIGAIIGQTLILLISWIKRKIDLSRKKQMILNDLNNQNKILDELTRKHLELRQLFEMRQTDQFTTSIFQVLQLDIYQSVPKNELYLIFKKNLSILVDIYKSIEFLKQNGPYWIYKDYLEKSELHLEEKKNDENHNLHCETELGFMDIGIKNIENNITTIKETKAKIKILTD
ncbi:hypothetical protein GCM10011531_05100 [Aquaticitalea lipolytica]|uniref:Uncharacterized protein n=1 Tax=Aquaticitalea lipolytica TaxID=1247562 RepID=A0A8J2TLP0_9FLAO|nr:hypothetical protein [Aquaticitalea lipolytica]GFZ78516.1 hypothetical protein GCM10011531_05100 [Aquaticitalea lipolytica]